MRNILSILTVVIAIIALWYVGSFFMNRAWVMDQAARAGETPSLMQQIEGTMTQDRAKLPAPHQVAQELWKGTVEKKVTSKRSLVYHGYITFQSTMAGFALGIFAGVALAVLIVVSRVADLALMPWAIISQTIPVVALAPMIVVLSNAVGFESLIVPKALIAAYLSFFPVLVSMIAGLRSPDGMQLDLLRTYGASQSQVFWKLRLPASLPYFFASLKIAVAASLVGAIVGELPTGAIAGLGARMLIGSQFGQPMIMWSALFAAAILAALLIWLVTGIEALAARMMGGRRA
ncbi:ABC transporter permease [Rhodalgimonas zhirmunskyi]|uniref:ABC transporter permease subunit n=1 Tax=Rhodalgimonas zhirmunskyi TaxID=2964767 RepID=A0AAJ1U3U1_9RHOB|nr:ABC transporter permease subunit [Rhodoalgimonas zhirmunskyi]MDQ2092720.1 ABC transporter permease subunit [Rhodoalgimonas zhirmunskyi]